MKAEDVPGKIVVLREIAEMLDHPSVYMGGPSQRNMRRAEQIYAAVAPLIAAQEREACAELVETSLYIMSGSQPSHLLYNPQRAKNDNHHATIAAAIRARGADMTDPDQQRMDDDARRMLETPEVRGVMGGRCEPPGGVVWTHHWVGPDQGDAEPWLWTESHDWVRGLQYRTVDQMTAMGWRYLAPVATPAETDALRAEVARLKDVDRAAQAIWVEYVKQHVGSEDWPTWGELLAQGHQGMKRVAQFRALARAALATEKPDA